MTERKHAPRQFSTLTDLARHYTRGITTRLGTRAHQLGIQPDMVTLVGLFVVAISAYAIAEGEFVLAAIIMLLGAPLDALDGAIARAMQRKGKFGAMLDSTLDRYADGLIFMGFAYYESFWGNETGAALSLAALLGSLMVSYVRARAEGLNIDCKVGLFTRMERMIVILVMLLTGWITIGLWILAVGTHITVVQRVYHVYRELKRIEAES